jgi:hypothetical protein
MMPASGDLFLGHLGHECVLPAEISTRSQLLSIDAQPTELR